MSQKRNAPLRLTGKVGGAGVQSWPITIRASPTVTRPLWGWIMSRLPTADSPILCISAATGLLLIPSPTTSPPATSTWRSRGRRTGTARVRNIPAVGRFSCNSPTRPDSPFPPTLPIVLRLWVLFIYRRLNPAKVGRGRKRNCILHCWCTFITLNFLV